MQKVWEVHKTIRVGICEEKQKGDLAVPSLCQCSKRIIIEMALVFNVSSFEIRRQLLNLILFEVSRRFVGALSVCESPRFEWHFIAMAGLTTELYEFDRAVPSKPRVVYLRPNSYKSDSTLNHCQTVVCCQMQTSEEGWESFVRT